MIVAWIRVYTCTRRRVHYTCMDAFVALTPARRSGTLGGSPGTNGALVGFPRRLRQRSLWVVPQEPAELRHLQLVFLYTRLPICVSLHMHVFMYAYNTVGVIMLGGSSGAPDHRSRAAKSDVVVRCFTLTAVIELHRATHGRRGSRNRMRH